MLHGCTHAPALALGLSLVWILGINTRVLMRLFGKAQPLSGPTREEVQVLIREGLVTGGVRPEESRMVAGVFDLREVLAEEIMQPKPKVLFLHVDDQPADYTTQVAASSQIVFPVYENSRDEIVGLVSLRDLYTMASTGHTQSLKDIMQPPVFVAENQPALSLMKTLSQSKLGAALVTDEFGTIRGLISLTDLIEEVMVEIRSQDPTHNPPSLRSAGDQAWLVDGVMEIDLVIQQLPDLAAAVEAEAEPFQTLAGFIVHAMDRLPVEGDTFSAAGYDFEIIDMDRQRIDKVLIRRSQNP